VEGFLPTPAEFAAVLLGIIYIVLIMRRNRWGWVFGGGSSIILTVLAAEARLPMQALLQFSYVVAAVYGWLSWSKSDESRPIQLWHWSRHLMSVGGCALLSIAMAQLLKLEGSSAWPFLDSMVACVGLLATWMVARVYLENWLYWLVIDAVSVFLFVQQDLKFPSLLFVAYFAISCFGFRRWLLAYRAQTKVP
jgi:nicotinamide mononucleotide transporter